MSKRFTRDNKRALQANREKRGGQVLKAFRRVDNDAAALIGGALSELVQSNDIPIIKPTLGYQAFVFDPRLMNKSVVSGMVAGLKIGNLISRLNDQYSVGELGQLKQSKDHYTIADGGYEAKLGELSLLPKNRRTLVVGLTSERLAAERAGFYTILAEQGIKGFTENGRRSGHGKETPTLALGTFKQSVPKANEAEILGAIDDSLYVRLEPIGNPELSLGDLVIKTYQPK